MVEFWEKHGEFVREMNEQDNEQSKWTRQNWKVFETYPEKDHHCAKHAIFVAEMNRKQVAKPSRKKTLEAKFEKFVQVFFATGSSTCKEVVKGAMKLSK